MNDKIEVLLYSEIYYLSVISGFVFDGESLCGMLHLRLRIAVHHLCLDVLVLPVCLDFENIFLPASAIFYLIAIALYVTYFSRRFRGLRQCPYLSLLFVIIIVHSYSSGSVLIENNRSTVQERFMKVCNWKQFVSTVQQLFLFPTNSLFLRIIFTGKVMRFFSSFYQPILAMKFSGKSENTRIGIPILDCHLHIAAFIENIQNFALLSKIKSLKYEITGHCNT
uniref:Uncharacterized protein n=1 Tax=Onchocerca volvulus TaxID=6282 RepID=A0A8R1XVC4_ONCVO